MRIDTLISSANTNCDIIAVNGSLPLGACQGAEQAQLELPPSSLYEYDIAAFSRNAYT